MVFCLGRAQPPPLSCFYGVSDNYGASVHRGENVQPGSHLSPASKERCTNPWSSAAAAAKSLQLCPTLCDIIDGSPSGSPLPWILQARTLEWVAISFSNALK